MALAGFGLYSHATMQAARRKAAPLPLAAAPGAAAAAPTAQESAAAWRVPAVHAHGKSPGRGGALSPGAPAKVALAAAHVDKENGGLQRSSAAGGKAPLLKVLQAHPSGGRAAAW